MFACKDWRDLAQQLIDSGALIEFNQGCDIRIMTMEMIDYIKQMRIKCIHFAWDRYKDKDLVLRNLKMFKEATGWYRQKICVYVLVNFDSTFEQDIERVMKIREIGADPYIMIYDKKGLRRGSDIFKLARWVNWKPFWKSFETFDEYTAYLRSTRKA